MIEVKKLVKTFDGFTALDSATLTVPKGAVYGLVGPNGLRYKLKKLSFTSLR